MTLRSKLAAFDDAALEALTSKGVVRRALRDHAAGAVTVVDESATSAVVAADGQDVTITDAGPAAARCTCPAAGICRHIVLAVMALRGDPADGGAKAGEVHDAAAAEESPQAAVGYTREAASGPSRTLVVGELCALTDAEIAKFAGARWADAVALAAKATAVELVARGSTCVVGLAEPKCSVTFIAGQGLAGAVCKGAKTRRRSVVAACAILVREHAGVRLSAEGAGAAPSSPTASTEFLEAASRALEQGVASVLPGRSATAADGFLDLAVSTRAEALPRLAGHLRGLAREARLGAARDVRFEPQAFLQAAARTYALIEALKRAPHDGRLTGVVKRDYAPAAPFDLWMLGVARWRAAGGARGLTAYGFSPGTGRWHSLSQGRAAGTDPTFDPAAAYRAPVWGAGTLEALTGKILHLPEPLVADDGAIAPILPRAASISRDDPSVDRLVEIGAAAADVGALRGDLAARVGRGLGRSERPLPALVVPASFGRLVFRDLEQIYEWGVIDRDGEALPLAFDADEHGIAERLRGMSRRIRAILVEASNGPRGPSFAPVSVLVEGNTGAQVLNVGFDDLPRTGPVGKTLERMRDAITGGAAPDARSFDTLDGVVTAVIDAAAAVVERSARPDLEKIAKACEACGLLSLARATRALHDGTLPTALRACYLASEAQTALWHQP